MILCAILLLNLITTQADFTEPAMICDNTGDTCSTQGYMTVPRYLFHEVNAQEGFNLRRDVYMRYAIMLAEDRKNDDYKRSWHLVLPPFYRLPHWKSDTERSKPVSWGTFFDVASLNNYVPVVEQYQMFDARRSFEIDVLFVLHNYPDAFEGGTFKDKWEISKDLCYYDGYYWGYSNVTAERKVCVNFQGKLSQIWDMIALYPTATRIMIGHAEIPLHDSYGTAEYWRCRKSMKYRKELYSIAEMFMGERLNCSTEKCDNYLAVHWRRQDFVQYRKKDIPSIMGAATQIDTFIKTNASNISTIFVATDASMKEMLKLAEQLEEHGYQVTFTLGNKILQSQFKDGGRAIVDQIICSRAAYFIGSHESTFTFRIQEERELLGFDSKTTYNRLCPDTGKCDPPSKWTVVY